MTRFPGVAAALIAGAGCCQQFPIYSRRGYDKDADEFKAGQVDGVIVASCLANRSGNVTVAKPKDLENCELHTPICQGTTSGSQGCTME